MNCKESGGGGTDKKSVVGEITYYDTAFDVETSDLVGRSPQLRIGTGSPDIRDWTFEAENLPPGVTIDNDRGVIKYTHTASGVGTVERKSYKVTAANTHDNYHGTIETTVNILIGNLEVVSGEGALSYSQPSPYTFGEKNDTPVNPQWDFSLVSPEKDPQWTAEDFHYSLLLTNDLARDENYPAGVTVSSGGVVSLTKTTPPGRYEFLVQAFPKDLDYAGSYLAELILFVNEGGQVAVEGTMTYRPVNFDISTVSDTTGIRPAQFDIATGSRDLKDWTFSGSGLPAGVSIDPNNGSINFDAAADDVAARPAADYTITAASSHHLYTGTITAFINITISDDSSAVVSDNGGFFYTNSGVISYGAPIGLSPAFSASEITPSKTPAWALDDFEYTLTLEGSDTDPGDLQIEISNTADSKGKITTTGNTPQGSYSLLVRGFPLDLNYAGSIKAAVIITIGSPDAELIAGNLAYDSLTAEFGVATSWDPSLNINIGKDSPWIPSDFYYFISGTSGITISNSPGTEGKLTVDGTQPIGTHSIVVKARPVDALSGEYVGFIEVSATIETVKAVLSGEALSYPALVTDYGHSVSTSLDFNPENINRAKDPVWVSSDFTYSSSVVPSAGSISINSNSGKISVGNTTPVGTYTVSVTAVPSSLNEDRYAGSLTGTASLTVNIIDIGEVAGISMEYPSVTGYYEKLFTSSVQFKNSPISASQYNYHIRTRYGDQNGINVNGSGVVSTSAATIPNPHSMEDPERLYALTVTATPKNTAIYTGSLSAAFNMRVRRRKITANLNTPNGLVSEREESENQDGWETGIIRFRTSNQNRDYTSHIRHVNGNDHWGEFIGFDDATLAGRYSGGTLAQEQAAARRWTWEIDSASADALSHVSIDFDNSNGGDPGILKISNSFPSGSTLKYVIILATPDNEYYDPVRIKVHINR